MKIDDDGASFARLNLFLKHRRLINSIEYDSLEWVRRERNRLHIQGLTESDTNYTDKKVKRVSKVLRSVVTKI